MPVDTHHPDFNAMSGKWKRCRDTMCGQDAVHSAGADYLPKLKDQEEPDYDAYKKRAVFYNATWRTISGLKGMLLKKPPIIDVPDALREQLKDVTQSGVPIELFMDNLCEEALGLGRIGVLVDYPQVDTALMTLADATRLNLRPTMQLYKAESIINWRTASVNNRITLSLVVLKECDVQRKDEFEDTRSDRFRVLDLDASGYYRVRLFRKTADKQSDEQIGNDIYPQMRGQKLDYIPFVFIGTDDVTPEVDEPPLIDLVDLNLSHYRTTADYEHAAHFTGLPTPVVTGVVMKEGEKLFIGSSQAWVFQDPNAKASFLEYSGSGLTPLRQVLQDKEQQMAVLGARMLEPQKKAQESPDSASIRRKGEESMLAAAAIAISLGITNALKWWADWAGSDPKDVKAELNRDFYPAAMTAQLLTALVQGWQAGAYSDQVLFENLQRAEIIGEDTTLEEEQARRADRAPDLAGSEPPPPTTNDAVPGKTSEITTPEGRKYHVKDVTP